MDLQIMTWRKWFVTTTSTGLFVLISKENKWYEFFGHRWKNCDNVVTLQNLISEEIHDKHISISTEYFELNKNKNSKKLFKHSPLQAQSQKNSVRPMSRIT